MGALQPEVAGTAQAGVRLWLWELLPERGSAGLVLPDWFCRIGSAGLVLPNWFCRIGFCPRGSPGECQVSCVWPVDIARRGVAEVCAISPPSGRSINAL